MFCRTNLVEFRSRQHWPTRRVAIVGTRAADEEALRFTRSLAQELAKSGALVVSGGAFGVDAAAHEGALDGDGVTCAVLAASVRDAYPPQHAPLFERIARTGLLVSEFDDAMNYRARFLRRNQLIAALATEVVVVQAPARSGALSTARAAISLGRPVFTLPASPWDRRSAGNLRLLASGAAMLTSAAPDFSSASQVTTPRWEQMKRSKQADGGRTRAARGNTNTPSSKAGDSSEDAASSLGSSRQSSREAGSESERILGLLSAVPRHPDWLAKESKLSARLVAALLTELELEGKITARKGGYVRVG